MLETLHFPNFDLTRQINANERSKILLSLGGRACTANFFRQIVPMFDRLYAVDRGLDIFYDTRIAPNFFIGDLDSAKQEAIEFTVRHNIETVKLKREKDDTDFQAALKEAEQREKLQKYEEMPVAVINSLGGRLDHLFSNIFTFSNIHSPFISFFMGDEKELVFFIHGGKSLTFNFKIAPRNISLLALQDIVTGVNLTGTKWNLANATLKPSLPYAISNEVENSKVTASCKTGLLAFYILFSKEEDILNG